MSGIRTITLLPLLPPVAVALEADEAVRLYPRGGNVYRASDPRNLTTATGTLVSAGDLITSTTWLVADGPAEVLARETPVVTAAVDPWMESTAICDNGIRFVAGTEVPLVSGQLILSGGFVIPAGATVNTITVFSGSTAAVAPTNQWIALLDQNLTVLRKSADKTSEAWPSLTYKTFTLSSPLSVSVDTAVYASIVVVAGTPNSLRGCNTSGSISSALPRLSGSSTTGLTNPASLGATAAAPAALGPIFYGFLG